MPKEEFQKLHEEAVAQGLHHYRDPATGYMVTTALGHRARGSCCGCGCRHCPFDDPCDEVDTDPTVVASKKDYLS